MLAMRACRSSIMIGKPLDRARMQRVLQHLSELDSPWNCPHGRCGPGCRAWSSRRRRARACALRAAPQLTACTTGRPTMRHLARIRTEPGAL